ncbi:hypothetical protein MMC22_007920 [Lobaria immixta]|nr:hypothetical protein [Lobaria immixta]
MFKSISRVSAARCSFAARSNSLRGRTISLVSIHRTSPATLYRFQLQRESRLYDKKLKEDDQDFSDAVEVSKDGLVRPGIIGNISNGALFMPNTYDMQELTRMHHDYYLDAIEDGKTPANPQYLCLPKGTSIPSSLILFREHRAYFSLQPSHPMSLNDLNNALTEFYFRFGIITSAGEWLAKHAYSEAFDDSKEDWMHQ